MGVLIYSFYANRKSYFFGKVLVFVICVDRRILAGKTGGTRKGPKLAYPHTILCFLKKKAENCKFHKDFDNMMHTEGPP